MHVAATANGAAWMHQMLVSLRARGYRTSAVIGGVGGSLEARLTRDAIPFEVLDLDIFSARSPLRAARKLWSLVQLLRRTRPDIVHFHLYPTIIVGRMAAWIADVPARFSMIPGTYFLESPVLGSLDVRTARFDSKVIASCEHTRTLYAESGIGRDHVPLIYYGQDHSLFNPDAADPERVRRELGIAPDRPVVGDVAYFYPPAPDNAFTPPHLINRGLKGHDVLLRAVPRVLARVPDALFVLVGNGWGWQGEAYMKDMQRLARELGIDRAVRFVGARSDIPDTLAMFDVSVQCSLNENLGGSIESLLMARPLVASDVGGLPDAVKHEQTGLLVPPGDVDALADAIVRLLLDRPLAERLARNGRQFALEHLTLDRTAQQLDTLYRDELARVATDDGGTPQRYRTTKTIPRAAFAIPWSVGRLILPVRWAARRRSSDRSRRRIIQMAGAVENGEWLVQICRRLRSAGHDVSAIVGSPERSLARRLQEHGVPYGSTTLSLAQNKGRLRLIVYALRVPGIVLRLALQFRRFHVQVVHTHIFNTIMIGRVAAWLGRVPLRVSMVPGPLHLEAPFTRALDRLTCFMDHRIVAGSEATYEHYRAMGLRPPRLQCIRYGVDPERFDPSAVSGSRVRRELGIPASAPLIGLVAYFYPPRTDWQTPPHIRGRGAKGHETFLAAARIVHTQFPDARFLLVGSGWGEAGERYRTRLMEEARDTELRLAVVFTGHRDDVPELLAAMDVAVQCSLTENYGGTIEALLMCRPVVATRVGGMPETVRHEATGLLVPPSDPDALAAAVGRLLRSPADARRMAEAGRALMLERFTSAQTATGIAEMYDAFFASPPAAASQSPRYVTADATTQEAP